MTAYIDTSAAAKLLVDEAESEALVAHVDHISDVGDRLVSSVLLETELRRFALRTDLPQQDVVELLSRIDLIDADRSMFTEAGLLPGRALRSLDALHVATALRAGAAQFLAYDERQQEAARAVGLRALAPA